MGAVCRGELARRTTALRGGIASARRGCPPQPGCGQPKALHSPALLSRHPCSAAPCMHAGALPKRLLTGARLVGGPNRREGRLEVQVAGTWGSVCNRNISDTATAHVVCRSLGFKGAAGARGGAFYGERAPAPVLEVLHCNGKEPGLHACTVSRSIMPEYCNRSSDFGVWCRGESEGAEQSRDASVRPLARSLAQLSACPATTCICLICPPLCPAPVQAARSLQSTACGLSTV